MLSDIDLFGDSNDLFVLKQTWVLSSLEERQAIADRLLADHEFDSCKTATGTLARVHQLWRSLTSRERELMKGWLRQKALHSAPR